MYGNTAAKTPGFGSYGLAATATKVCTPLNVAGSVLLGAAVVAGIWAIVALLRRNKKTKP